MAELIAIAASLVAAVCNIVLMVGGTGLGRASDDAGCGGNHRSNGGARKEEYECQDLMW